MKVTLKLDVHFDTCDFDCKEDAERAAMEQLTLAIQHLTNNGLLSGDTDLMVDTYNYTIESI